MTETPNDARAQILGGIRRSLRRGELSGEARSAVEARLAEPPRGPSVARGQLPQAEKVDLFCEWAETLNATVARVGPADVPGEVSAYLARTNLPANVAMAPSPLLEGYDWASQKTSSRSGAAAAWAATRSRSPAPLPALPRPAPS